MKVSIDRIEEGIAVLVVRHDPGGQIQVPASSLPHGCREGDILNVTFERDPMTAAAAKEHVSELVKKIKKHR